MATVSTKNVDQMTPGQCRAARSLLDMTQSQLADAAGLGLSTIVDFEKERRLVSVEAVSGIRAALEKTGVEFIDENGGGAGVRLKGASGSLRKHKK
jgi:transcriptional regulator with XRE-family HTH domain